MLVLPVMGDLTQSTCDFKFRRSNEGQHGSASSDSILSL